MRISDWSSDVCSSDLLPEIISVSNDGCHRGVRSRIHARDAPEISCMRLTVQPRRDDPSLAPLSAVFQAPGGTLGRSADNHLALPDSEQIGRASGRERGWQEV